MNIECFYLVYTLNKKIIIICLMLPLNYVTYVTKIYCSIVFVVNVIKIE